MRKLPVALQLWSVKDYLKDDFFGTLQKIADAGYDGVEFAGYYDLSAKEIKEELDKIGLKIAGSHISADKLANELDDVIAFEKELGNKNIVCPGHQLDDKKTLDELVQLMTRAGKVINEAGLKLFYHNHAHEFVEIDGAYGLDLLFEQVSEELLQTEIDTYWVKKAGVEPCGYLKNYAGRMPLVHIKEMHKSGECSTIVGEGIMDIAGLVRQAEAGGCEWLVIEQEEFEGPSIEEVAVGCKNLKDIISAQ